MKFNPFKPIILLSGILIFGLTLSTCKKEKEEVPSDGVMITAEAKIIEETTWNQNFIDFDSLNYTLTFSKSEAIENFKVGDIIVSGKGEGLLRRVTSLETVNNEIIVHTEAAAITELIKQGLVDFKQQLTIPQIKSIEYRYEGISLDTSSYKNGDQTNFNWDINTVLYDDDGNTQTTGDQVRLAGDFNCDWQFIALIDIGLIDGLKEVKFGFESNESLDLELIAGIQYTLEESYTLAVVNFTPIVVMVGVVPLVFTPQLKIDVGIDGYANASITTSISQNLGFEAGVQYLKASGWNSYNTYNKSLNFQPPQLNMNAGAEAYLKPELSVKLFSVTGPFTNLKLYGKIEADLLATPWWRIYGGLNMSAGVNVEILDRFLLEYTVSDLINYEELIAEASDNPGTLATVSNYAITNISKTTARGGGNISAEGSASVTERGVCWSTSQSPTVSDAHTSDGIGIGGFYSNINGLTQNTLYYVRAYATNTEGTAYSENVSFTTLSGGQGGTVTDIDGNVYQTVIIGTQQWMAENLKVTHYRNGEQIPYVTDDAEWLGLTTGAYCWYNDDQANYGNEYGALYNWNTVADSRNLCPVGWHIPSDAEWTTLTEYLGGSAFAGGQLKEAGTAHWLDPNYGATNESGFTGLPGGLRSAAGWDYQYNGENGYYWSSSLNGDSSGYLLYLTFASTEGVVSWIGTRDGCSVRCIKD
jgi:uncharacterized protein (TIGR02145 family)